jgi:hypothetical protein
MSDITKEFIIDFSIYAATLKLVSSSRENSEQSQNFAIFSLNEKER